MPSTSSSDGTKSTTIAVEPKCITEESFVDNKEEKEEEEDKRDTKKDTEISQLITEFICKYETYSENSIQSTKNECLFEMFIQSFDSLLSKLVECKEMDNGEILVKTFQNTNVLIIELYELIDRMLNIEMRNSGDESSHQTKDDNLTILCKTIELLHVLTSRQYSAAENDEPLVRICYYFSNSFNFTSSLCHLITLQMNEYKKMQTNNDSYHIIDTKTFRMAFRVLLNLTADYPLFSIDMYVEQLINYSIERIINGDEDLIYIQLLSNIVRNNPIDIIKNNRSFKILCAKLIENAMSSQDNGQVLNSLIINVKVCFENMFLIQWPTSSLNNIKTSSIKKISTLRNSNNSNSNNKHIKSNSTSAQIIDSLNLATRVLSMPDWKLNQSGNNFNAINFINEMIKRPEAKEALESNEDYLNVFLFKLNQLVTLQKITTDLTEDNNEKTTSKCADQLPTSLITKVKYKNFFFFNPSDVHHLFGRTTFRMAMTFQKMLSIQYLDMIRIQNEFNFEMNVNFDYMEC
jgi:hypothetical protein